MKVKTRLYNYWIILNLLSSPYGSTLQIKLAWLSACLAKFIHSQCGMIPYIYIYEDDKEKQLHIVENLYVLNNILHNKFKFI